MSDLSLFKQWNKSCESIAVIEEPSESQSVTAMGTKATGPVSGRAVVSLTTKFHYDGGAIARVTLSVQARV